MNVNSLEKRDHMLSMMTLKFQDDSEEFSAAKEF